MLSFSQAAARRAGYLQRCAAQLESEPILTSFGIDVPERSYDTDMQLITRQ
jgi:hypothetical protein